MSMEGMPPYGYGSYGPPPAPSLESRVAKRLGVVLLIFTAAFGLTLAVMVGQRLSDQAMAVIAGAVCGVAASIPPSLLIIWVTRRKPGTPQAWAGPYPPVVVVQPPAMPSVPTGATDPRYPPTLIPASTVPMQREFVVVGEDD
jgi:hypothetical protein